MVSHENCYVYCERNFDASDVALVAKQQEKRYDWSQLIKENIADVNLLLLFFHVRIGIEFECILRVCMCLFETVTIITSKKI